MKVISGGQTGADIAALIAARELGLETGGFAPTGWLSENGAQEALLRSFGMIECGEPGYPPRTRANVIHSDGTLLVGDHSTGGSHLTYQIATELKKPVFILDFVTSGITTPAPVRIEEFRSWLQSNQIKTLNVAGNRESQTPGIAEFTRKFLLNAL